MTRAEYEASLCARREDAAVVPFLKVAFDGWSPKVGCCHQNADMWVRANPEFEVVRGWVTYASFGGDSFGLTAHSIVRDRSGALFDITPLDDEGLRASMHFILHEGDPTIFFEMKALGINICCLAFDITELTAEPFLTDCNGIGEEE